MNQTTEENMQIAMDIFSATLDKRFYNKSIRIYKNLSRNSRAKELVLHFYYSYLIQICKVSSHIKVLKNFLMIDFVISLCFRYKTNWIWHLSMLFFAQSKCIINIVFVLFKQFNFLINLFDVIILNPFNRFFIGVLFRVTDQIPKL